MIDSKDVKHVLRLAYLYFTENFVICHKCVYMILCIWILWLSKQKYWQEQQEFLETNLPESIKVQTKTVQPNPTFEELGSEETQIKQGSLPACKFVDHTVGNFAARKPALSSGPPTHRLVLRSPSKFSSRHTSSYKITTPPEVKYWLYLLFSYL